MSFFGIGGGKSKSSNVQSNVSGQYSVGENISQSGSQQGSDSFSGGLDISQSAQNIYGGQEPYLRSLYANAANLYNNYGMPDKQVAGLNPYLAQGIDQAYGFSQGGGQDIYTAQLLSSLNNLGGYDTAGMAANRMAGGNVYNAPMTSGMDMRTLGMAVNNPYLDGMVSAATRGDYRNLTENQLTGNAAAAAGTGNSGSSRRAVMDAIAMRGYQDRVSDVASNMYGNAYSQGLGLANQTALANQQARLSTNALNAGLMGQGANLAANLGEQGQRGLGQAYQTGANNAQMAQDSGNYLRQYQQQLLDTMYSNQMNPYQSLEMYKSFIGAPTVLSSSNSIGLNNSRSTSFGNSFNNAYSYDQSAAQSAGSGTGKSSSWNMNASFGGGS